MTDMSQASNQRHERVVLETVRHRIDGTLTLARDGYRSRVSDLLNTVERDFITLTDASVRPLTGDEPPAVHEFLAVGRRHIIFLSSVGPVTDNRGKAAAGPAL